MEGECVTPPRVIRHSVTKKAKSNQCIATVFNLIHPVIAGEKSVSSVNLRKHFKKMTDTRRITTVLHVLTGLGYLQIIEPRKVYRYVGPEGMAKTIVPKQDWPLCAKEANVVLHVLRKTDGVFIVQNNERRFYEVLNILQAMGLVKRLERRRYEATTRFYDDSSPPPPPPVGQCEWLQVFSDEKTEALLSDLPF